MAWTLKVNVLESCSCASLCPCVLGPAKPDQEWCSGVFGLNVTEGDSDGVDLSGAKLVLHFELPGDFLGGIDKGKLYLDSSLSDEQRRELDAIFHGEKGGLWGGMKETIGQWLPSTVASVQFSDGDTPGVTVEGIGQITLQPIKNEAGEGVTLTGAPIIGAFGMSTIDLAYAHGTGFSDSDMRAWESLGQGSMTDNVVWTG